MANHENDNTSQKWSELKNLLLEEETKRLQTLEGKILHPQEFAKSISEVLADAVQNTHDKTRLSQKLYPIVEQSIYKSVQKNPESLADAIYPVLSPAIRKAINDAMRKITENVNQSINNGFSAQALKWRVQSLFTGQSFGDIVLKNSLIYQVTEAYLIHADTGLLIAHQSQHQGGNPDGDMISGMLTALRDFVGDSFNISRNDSLETIEIGGFSVLIEQGPHASLACVVNGEATIELKLVMKDVLVELHKEFGPELVSYSGDNTNFEDSHLILQKCLVTKLDQDDESKSNKMKWIFLTLAFVVFFLFGYKFYWGYHWRKLQNDLSNVGCEIIKSDKKGKTFSLLAFGDIQITAYELGGKDSTKTLIHYTNKDLVYDTITTRIKEDNLTISLIETSVNESLLTVENRLRRILENDPDIKISIALIQGKETIVIQGKASAERVRQLNNWLPFFTYDYPLAFSQLLAYETFEIQDIKKDIESILLFYHAGTVELIPDQEYTIARLNELLSRMDELCMRLDESWKLEVSGSTDSTGTIAQNNELENQRALYVVDQLIAENIKHIFIYKGSSSGLKNEKIKPLIKKLSEYRHTNFELTKVTTK